MLAPGSTSGVLTIDGADVLGVVTRGHINADTAVLDDEPVIVPDPVPNLVDGKVKIDQRKKMPVGDYIISLMISTSLGHSGGG